MASIYDTPADLNLIQTYVPLPFEEMASGLEARQGRYDQQAQRIGDGAEAFNIPAAGSADRQYMAALKEGYARDVVEEFPYGQVDLTDPNVSSRLNKKIHEYTNRPEFLTIASNAEVYPELRESVQKAMVEQPFSTWNYEDALNTMNMFDEFGTPGVGDLTNVAIAEPADVPGTLYDILNNLKATDHIGEEDLTALRRRIRTGGVLPKRIGHAFGIDLETGEAVGGMPNWFLGNEIGQELSRMASQITSREEGVTEENYNERLNENLTSLYEDTVTNLLNAYAYNRTEDIRGLGSLLSKGIETDEGPVELTYTPTTAATGLFDYQSVSNEFEQSFVDKLVLNTLTSLGSKEEVDLEGEANMMFRNNLPQAGINDKEGTLKALDKGREEFINKTEKPFGSTFKFLFSGDYTGTLHEQYQNVWGDMIENYAETLYDTIVLTSDDFKDVRHFVEDEETIANIETTAQLYDQEYGMGEFNNLTAPQKARYINRKMFEHLGQLRAMHLEVPANRGDYEEYNEDLAHSIFNKSDPKDPLAHEAQSDGDAPGILAGTTAFTQDGKEFNFSKDVNRGDVIRLSGKLAANNPYGPGFFMATVKGKSVFFEGSQVEKNQQYLPWHLYGYSRAYNGISEDVFQQTIGDTNYELRTVDDINTGNLRIDYRKPGSERWETYDGPQNSIIDLYNDFISEFE